MGALAPTRVRTVRRESGCQPDGPQLHVTLLERARSGDAAAWQQLITAFTPMVEGVARRVCSDNADVDDVAQEVWLLLLRNVDKIRSPECLPGWLLRVTTNTAIQQLRRHRAQLYAELPEQCLVDEDHPSDAQVGSHASRDGVHLALGRLRQADRTLLELLMAQERPDYANISQQVDRPIGSIGPTRQRLLKRLSRDPAIVRLAAD